MSDYRTTTGEPLPSSRKDKMRRRRVWLRRSAFFVPLFVLLGLLIPVRVQVAANGYLAAESYAEVRPAQGGQVAGILGFSGERVDEGALLVQLEDGEERAVWEASRRAVAAMEARLALRRGELAQVQAQHAFRMREARLRLAHAERDLDLTRELHTRGLASERALAQGQVARDLAEVAWQKVAEEDVSLPALALAVLERELEVLQSAVERDAVRLQSRQIRAPITGQLVRYEFVRGELVGPEHVLFEIIGDGPQILKLRIPERFATRVVPGTVYRARVRPVGRWSRGGVFRGEVLSLRSIIQADDQQAYRMAYCSFDGGAHVIPPGASAEARITVARVPFWLWLFGIR